MAYKIAAAMREREEAARVGYTESEAWDAFEAGYMQGHNDTVESCVRDSKEAAQDYFADHKPHAQGDASVSLESLADKFAFRLSSLQPESFPDQGEWVGEFYGELMLFAQEAALLARAPRGESDEETPLEKHYRSEIEMWKEDIDETRKRAEAAEAERDALREAIKPFTAAFERIGLPEYSQTSQHLYEMLDANIVTPKMTMGDFRRLFDAAKANRTALLRAEKPEAGLLKCEGCGCTGNMSCGREADNETDCSLDEAGFCRCCQGKQKGSAAPKPEARTCESDMVELKRLEKELLNNGVHRLFLDNFERTVGRVAMAGGIDTKPAASDRKGE